VAQRCPPPPSTLPPFENSDVLVSSDLMVARVYSAGGTHPSSWNGFRYFGPVLGMRFDHHTAPRRQHRSYGIAYAATNWHPTGPVDPLPCAIAETSRGFVIDRRTDEPWLTLWSPDRPLHLLLLSDSNWVARAHGNAALTSGSTAIAQHWSRRIWRQMSDIDGLCWSSSPYPNRRSIALFERAAHALPSRPSLHVPLTHPGLTPALERISVELAYPLI
jgi:hypothetical protein